MGTPRHLTAALAALLTLGLTTGCTDDAPDKDTTTSSTEDGSRTTVEMTEVKGTESLRPRTTVIGGWDSIVSGKRSTVVVEVSASDGTPDRLVSVDPEDRTRHPLDLTAPAWWSAAANARTAIVAGDLTREGAPTPFVRVSTDLRTWRKVPISHPGKGWSVNDVGLDGTVPLVIASGPDGKTVLMRRDGADWSTHAIPAAKGQEISPISLVEHRGKLVLLVGEARRGDESVARVLTSRDGGRTWRRGRTLPGTRGSYGIAGLVSTGKQLVATGWAEQKAPRGTSGMVWSSADGTTWKRSRPVQISWDTTIDVDAGAEDYHLTPPEVVDGQATFDQTCNTCTWTTRFQVDRAGVAHVRDNDTRIRAVEPSSRVLTGGSRSSAGVRMVAGSLIASDGDSARTLLRGERPRWVNAIEDLGPRRSVAVGEPRFSGDPDDGWQVTTHLTPYVLDGTLQRKGWSPKALEEWGELRTATSPDGTTVAVGTATTQEGFRADARTLVDGKWRAAKGLGRAGFESVSDVTHASGRFLMHLVTASNGSFRSTRQASIYASKDGVTWQPEKGRWARSERAGSAINDVCELADGTPFAVGSSQATHNARYEATTWSAANGGWRLATPQLTGEGASFDSCATTGRTTVVSGSMDGADIEWTTTDGTAFTARTPLPRGTYRGTPHEVEGGLVASGYLDTADHVGPVVWFSTDGRAWQWAPVDVDDVSADVSVMTAGKDVYAVTSQTGGDRIWTIDKISTTKVTGDEG